MAPRRLRIGVSAARYAYRRSSRRRTCPPRASACASPSLQRTRVFRHYTAQRPELYGEFLLVAAKESAEWRWTLVEPLRPADAARSASAAHSSGWSFLPHFGLALVTPGPSRGLTLVEVAAAASRARRSACGMATASCSAQCRRCGGHGSHSEALSTKSYCCTAADANEDRESRAEIRITVTLINYATKYLY